ncbi:hypothetical protein F5884DRAFT_253948 [Xylogone sp. PMI_703]|nr:hypothetical protein F5884DRAFT_253948 [Xylogone sp. PMI_703]
MPDDSTDRMNAAPPRRLKACRTCRRQKMRCTGSPESPCPRCVNAGVECIFDFVEERRANEDGADLRGQKRRFDALEDDFQSLRRDLQSLTSIVHEIYQGPPEIIPDSTIQVQRVPSNPLVSRQPHSLPQTPDDTDSNQDRTNLFRNLPSDNAPRDTREAVDDGPITSSGLNYMNSEHLKAPVSAVHAMTPSTPFCSQKSLQVQSRDKLNFHPPLNVRSIPPSLDGKRQTDHTTTETNVLANIFPDESRARDLYALFCGGANPFLPMFDQSVDLFDCLYHRSSFCMVTILYVASRPDRTSYSFEGSENLEASVSDLCLKECRRLATESLFEKPASLESVQAMILLAAYTENAWFVIGHALQMALDLGLDTSMNRLLQYENLSRVPPSTKVSHSLAQQCRTWLILYHIERELAFGTARRPRIPEIEKSLLESYLNHPIFRPSDMRFICTIEIVHLRGTLQAQIENSPLSSNNPLSWIQNIEQNAQDWFEHWDALFEEHGFHPSSFHRVGIWVLRNYTIINVCCAVMGKLQRERGFVDQITTDEIIRRTIRITVNQLHFISSSNSYRWHFRWAPTYSALMLTFLAVLALQMSRRWPEYLKQSEINDSIIIVAQMLSQYPYPGLGSHIHKTLNMTAEYNRRMMAPVVNDNRNGEIGQQAENTDTLYSRTEQEVVNGPSGDHQWESLDPSLGTTPDWFLGSGFIDSWSIFDQGNPVISDFCVIDDSRVN